MAISGRRFEPAIIRGYKFFDSGSGQEFLVRGIDYYPRPNQGDLNHNSLDLFTAQRRHIWERDILYLQELGVNAVRLYAVDPSQNHDAFMCALQAANIYAIVALARDCPTCAVTKDPAPECYPPELKRRGQQVIQAFAKYSNTLAFSAGNEVNHYAPPNAGPEWNAPCQKKFLQDMREYLGSTCSQSLRRVPIGLISADNDRETLAAYYNCREDEQGGGYETAEWYGLNSYVLCDGAATDFDQAPGLKLLQQSFERLNYSIPVLLTEFGCLSHTFPTVQGYPGQRTFLEARWLQTQAEFHDQFAGGFAFEYSMEMENAKAASPYPFTAFGQQNYGIGYFGPENCDDVTIPCVYHPLPAYDFLKKALNVEEKGRVTLSHQDDFIVPQSRQGNSPCPSKFPRLDSFVWEADSLPSIPCPSHVATLVCPTKYQELLNESETRTASRFWFALVLVVGGAGVVGIFVLLVTFNGNSDHRLSGFITKASDAENRCKTGSQESVSLLSLKSYLQSDIDTSSTS